MTDQAPVERRRPMRIDQDQIEEIANLAAVRAVQLIKQDAYQQIGKSVVDKLLWMVGIVAVGLFFWAEQKGFLRR